MKLLKFIGMVCLILGVSFIGTGIFFNMSEKEFIEEAISTEATIANIRTQTKDGKQTTHPYVKYTSERKNKNGEIESTEHYIKINYYNPEMEVGDKITKKIRAGKPTVSTVWMKARFSFLSLQIFSIATST